MSAGEWLEPGPVKRLVGSERFRESPLTTADFWSFAFSDLRENITRGVLAEFLVARAVGADQPTRSAWDNVDVLAPDGTRIEVKASAYLQSWPQRRLSTISFGGLSARSWNGPDGYGQEREYRADVFVFCVQTCQSPDGYDPLALDQWDFYAVPVSALSARGAPRSVGLGFLREQRIGPVGFHRLSDAVTAAASDRATPGP